MNPSPRISTVQMAETHPRHQTVSSSGSQFHSPAPTPFARAGTEAHQYRTAKDLLVFGLLFVILPTPRTEAAITFSNPMRKVSSSNNWGSLQEFESTGFEKFDEMASVEWEEQWANTTGQYIAKATQESTIGSSGISAKGTVISAGSFYYLGEQSLEQSALSLFSIGINVESPCDLTLTGTIVRQVDFGGTNISDVWINVIVLKDSDEIYSFLPESEPYPQDYMWENRQIDRGFHFPEPGQYQLIIEAEANGNYDNYDGLGGVGGSGSLFYDISLVPEPMPFLSTCLGGLLFIIRRSRSRPDRRT
jgi:hypothetical protein